MREISLADRYSLNIYQNKLIQYNRNKHLNRIAAIYKQKKTDYDNIEKQQEKILEYIHRNKQANRIFKQTQTRRNIERSDKILQQRLLYQSCTKTIPLALDASQISVRPQRKDYKKVKEQEQIDRQNLKIHLALFQQKKSKKKYRKEVQKNIDNYLKLRDRIMRLKINTNEKRNITSIDSSITPSKCQKKKKNFRSKTQAYTSLSKSHEKLP